MKKVVKTFIIILLYIYMGAIRCPPGIVILSAAKNLGACR